MEKLDQRPSLWTRKFITAAAVNLLLFFSFQMLIPTMPVQIASLGGKQLQTGLVMAVFTLSSLLARPFAGRALDRYARGRVLTAGLLVCLTVTAGYSFTRHISIMLLLRFLHGLGWGFATTSLGTVATDLVPRTRRGEGIGYFGALGTLAMALGPFAGTEMLSGAGFTAMIWLSVLLAAISLGLACTISVNHSLNTIRKGGAWVESQALLPAVLLFFTAFCYGGVVTFITLFGTERRLSSVSSFFICNALMVLLTRPLTGLLYDRKGPGFVLIPGACCTAGGLWLLSNASTQPMLAVAALLYGTGFGSLQPSLQAWAVSRTEPERRGAANGTFFAFNDLGIGAGALLLGAVAKMTGSYSSMYRISTLSILLFLFFYVAWRLMYGGSSQTKKNRPSSGIQES